MKLFELIQLIFRFAFIAAQVKASMTAEDLLQQMQRKAQLQADKHCAMFECICNEELGKISYLLVLTILIGYSMPSVEGTPWRNTPSSEGHFNAK
jgi:hypothetical protein